MKLFLDELWKPFDGRVNPTSSGSTTDSIERLRTIATEALLGVFQPTLTAKIEKASGRSSGIRPNAGPKTGVLRSGAPDEPERATLPEPMRTRPVGPAGASIVIGVVFGSIHYTGPDTLALIPPLIALGVAFCVLYERTGSLYPAIALHAINNALTFSLTAGADAAPVVGAAGLTIALAVCAHGTRTTLRS